MRKSEILAEQSVRCLTIALNRLKDIWEDIGIQEEQRLQRTDTVKVHIKTLLDAMIAEEEGLKHRLLKDIEIFHKELDTLCQELDLPLFEKDDDKTILQQEKDLRTRRDVLLKQKNERIAELKILQARDQELCGILCTPLHYMDYDAVPSLDELDHFRRHLIALAEEKDRRKAEFVSTKTQIRLCMEELDRAPDSSFEREVLDEDEEFFCLSIENIASLQILLLQLQEQKAQNEAVCIQLRSRITALWNRLHIPSEEQDAFSVYMTGSKAKTRRKLETELERLEKFKRENLQQVIIQTRKELELYWEKCFYSFEQKQAFSPFYDVNFTEDLHSLHDDEIFRLKHHYEVREELFEGVKKWEDAWKQFLECERKENNPHRLENRGGNLLKEQREHAKLNKTLPKMEEELKVRIERWEQKQQEEVLVYGQKFMDYVSAQRQMLHNEKEKEKLERAQKKKSEIAVEMHYGSTPCKRKAVHAPTPGKSRKLNGTSISSTSTNTTTRSLFGGTICHSPASRPPYSGCSTIPAKTPMRGKPPRMGALERVKENVSQLNGTTVGGVYIHTATAQRNLSVNSVASTYSEFARELSKASRSDTPSRILNSTSTNIQPYGL